MIPLGDPKWKKLKGGYKVPYDPSSVLLQLERGEDVWSTLWEKLHHQGDVGEASYAAVPHLVRIAKNAESRDWNFYGLVSIIEVQRHFTKNPPLPKWLSRDYKAAWNETLTLATDDIRQISDPATIPSIISAIALGKGALKLGALLCTSDKSEIDEFLEQQMEWSKFYK